MKLTQIPSEICQTYMGCQESIASLNGLQYHHKLIYQTLPKLFQGNHDRFYHSKADQCTCRFWIWKSQQLSIMCYITLIKIKHFLGTLDYIAQWFTVVDKMYLYSAGHSCSCHKQKKFFSFVQTVPCNL